MRPKVVLPARGGQIDLTLALGGALQPIRIGLGSAFWAGTSCIAATRTIFCPNLFAPAGAELLGAGCEVVPQRYPFVENEALAPPQALLGWDLLEIFQDAALEMVDLVEALLLQICRRLLTAYAAGAKHRDFGLLPSIEVVLR